MQQSLKLMVGLIDRFTHVIGLIIAPLLAFMLLGTVAVVFIRYGLDSGAQGLQEAVMYLHATVFMLGFAYTLKAGGHVRVDIIYQSLSTKKQALVNLLGSILLLVPMCAFILYSSYDYVVFSWRLQEGSPEPGGLSYVYVLKTLIPMSALLLLVQGIAETLRNSIILLQKTENASYG